MGKKVSSEKITREAGYLYYVGGDGYVWRSPMRSNKSGTKKKVGNEKIDRKSGFMYYVDGEGYICEAPMKHA